MALARKMVSQGELTNLERVSSHVTVPAAPILEEV